MTQKEMASVFVQNNQKQPHTNQTKYDSFMQSTQTRTETSEKIESNQTTYKRNR